MSRSHGFTILEIIITLVIGAILASLMLPFMGSALVKSGFAVAEVQDNYEIVQAVEGLTAAYREELQQGSLDLATFNADLSTYASNGVTFSGTWLNYRTGGNLADSDGDGAYDPQTSVTATNYLLVTATKGDQSVDILFAE